MSENNSISLASLNIEGSKHLDRVSSFLVKEQPEVFCVQELFKEDIPTLQEAFQGEVLFTPIQKWAQEDRPLRLMGIGIMTRLPILKSSAEYYRGDAENTPEHIVGDPTKTTRAVLTVTVEKNGESYNIGTTHFTWSPDGEASEHQRQDLPPLLAILENMPEFVLAGDFNAPRGKEIFDTIATRYKDNIPPEYKTSIDRALHRRKNLVLMVDGLFTTPQYTAESTRLIDGLSDHCAILSRISKSKT